jgi:hypothetical protein
MNYGRKKDRHFDLLGLKGDGGKLEMMHKIDNQSAIKLAIAATVSSLVVLFVGMFIKGCKKD